MIVHLSTKEPALSTQLGQHPPGTMSDPAEALPLEEAIGGSPRDRSPQVSH
jgi:hypothetical protein